ncbi:MAG: DUF3108 domain-containing protein [Flavobacteriales bacterium]|jgi:hypothetical protein|tara:strand:- start:14153 stop:14971 length:819 start_codon:yes stop_codon:yes gene_type:complete
MRFRILLILLILFYSKALPSQEYKGLKAPFLSSSNNSFKKGEWLKFRLHYGFFNASYATLNLEEEILNNELLYKATAIGRTTGIARLFFKVDDIYETYFNKALVKPLRSTRNIYEGGYTKNIEITYDYLNNTANINDIKNSKLSSVSIQENIQDLISTFYYLRNHFNIENLKKNDFIRITIFFDAENYNFRMQFLGTEDVKTKFGIVNCFKFRPYIESGRVFKDSESLTLWVSNDKNKIPIKVEAGLRIGSIEADLDQFKGLKFPFKIKINE